MTQSPRDRLSRWPLPIIVTIYLTMGVLYAIYTPAWQAPDEPAHYNYVRYLAEKGSFPVLRPGDYPAAYLEEIKAARFPPGMSIDPIRYEFHQPPLYYILASAVYRLFGGALLPLRLLSVVIGGVLLLVIHRVVRVMFTGQPSLALAATAFVAFLPMHLAFMSSVNNDTLAELLQAMVLLLAVGYLKDPKPGGEAAGEFRLLVLLGITTGLGLVTKTSVYVAVPVVLAAIAARHWWLGAERRPATNPLGSVVLYLVPAIAMATPWWVRNWAVYGLGSLNFMGLGRHDQVVVGQLRTSEFMAENGFARLAHDFVVTSFHSFWGQFGWMGVLLDERLYQALAILSCLGLAGFLIWAVHVWRQRAQLPAWQCIAAALLALSGLLTLGSYLWYNASFVQHQGRYLFPALLPIGLVAALGWREALRRRHAISLTLAVVFAAVILRAAGVLANWPLVMLGGLAGVLAVNRVIPKPYSALVHVFPYLLMIALDLTSLFLFIVPQLAG